MKSSFPQAFGSLLTSTSASDQNVTCGQMAQTQQIKNYFKAPEGRYLMHSERTTGCSFVPSRPVRLTFATVQHQGSAHNYVIYNILDALAFCFYAAVDKVSCLNP